MRIFVIDFGCRKVVADVNARTADVEPDKAAAMMMEKIIQFNRFESMYILYSGWICACVTVNGFLRCVTCKSAVEKRSVMAQFRMQPVEPSTPNS